MALMHGKLGKMYWDIINTVGSDINLTYGQSWTVDLIHTLGETTSMQDTWRTYMGGFKDWTATVECLEDAAGPKIVLGGDDGMGDDECGLELYFTFDTANYQCLFGTAICSGVSPGTNADGISTISYTFQGVAQLAWDTGASRPGAV